MKAGTDDELVVTVVRADRSFAVRSEQWWAVRAPQTKKDLYKREHCTCSALDLEFGCPLGKDSGTRAAGYDTPEISLTRDCPLRHVANMLYFGCHSQVRSQRSQIHTHTHCN